MKNTPRTARGAGPSRHRRGSEDRLPAKSRRDAIIISVKRQCRCIGTNPFATDRSGTRTRRGGNRTGEETDYPRRRKRQEEGATTRGWSGIIRCSALAMIIPVSSCPSVACASGLVSHKRGRPVLVLGVGSPSNRCRVWSSPFLPLLVIGFLPGRYVPQDRGGWRLVQ